MRQVKIVLDPDMRKLCQRPYYNHPKGCPNFGKCESCPPQAPLLPEVLNVSEPIWAIWSSFDLAAHRESMRQKHSNWSERQLNCCLYWQGTVEKDLRRKVTNFCTMRLLYRINKKLEAIYRPEAMGVNVTETMKSVGVLLEWPPKNIVYKVALVGVSVKR